MASYKAEGLVAIKAKGRVHLEGVVTKDGVKVEDYVGPETANEQSARSIVMAHLEELYNADIFDIAKIGTLEFIPSVPVAPPVADPARDKFITDMRAHIGLLVAVKLGYIAADAKTVTDQLALVTPEFLPAYAPLLAGVNVP